MNFARKYEKIQGGQNSQKTRHFWGCSLLLILAMYFFKSSLIMVMCFFKSSLILTRVSVSASQKKCLVNPSKNFFLDGGNFFVQLPWFEKKSGMEDNFWLWFLKKKPQKSLAIVTVFAMATVSYYTNNPKFKLNNLYIRPVISR